MNSLVLAREKLSKESPFFHELNKLHEIPLSVVKIIDWQVLPITDFDKWWSDDGEYIPWKYPIKAIMWTLEI